MEEPSTANSVEDYRWIISPSPWSNVRPSRTLIAIVDDDASIRKALARLIASFNLEVATFASGKEFLDCLAVRRPDCLLLDLHMPVLSGIDVMTALASQGWALPTVVITGREEPSSRARCLALGALAYLSKPVDPGRLLQALGEALGVNNSSSATERDRGRQ